MSNSHSSRRMVENEVVFREYNERIQKGFDRLQQLAVEEGKANLNFNNDIPLHFYCECSDENCKQRIMLQPTVYEDIHKNRSRFIIINGHQVNAVERVVYSSKDYTVVEKYIAPPPKVGGLQPTPISNI